MLKAIADTHVIIWYIFGDKRLSVTARQFIDVTNAQGNQIGISSVSLAEVVYLVEKGRVPSDTFNQLIDLLRQPASLLIEYIFDRQIAQTMFEVERVKVPDFPDRMITATASYLKVPLISRDAKIQTSGINIIW